MSAYVSIGGTENSKHLHIPLDAKTLWHPVDNPKKRKTKNDLVPKSADHVNIPIPLSVAMQILAAASSTKWEHWGAAILDYLSLPPEKQRDSRERLTTWILNGQHTDGHKIKDVRSVPKRGVQRGKNPTRQPAENGNS